MSTHLSPRRQTLRWIVLACLTLLAGAVALAQPLAADAHAARTAKAARAIPRSLSLAATRSTRADRALVADAQALRRGPSRGPGPRAGGSVCGDNRPLGAPAARPGRNRRLQGSHSRQGVELVRAGVDRIPGPDRDGRQAAGASKAQRPHG